MVLGVWICEAPARANGQRRIRWKYNPRLCRISSQIAQARPEKNPPASPHRDTTNILTFRKPLHCLLHWKWKIKHKLSCLSLKICFCGSKNWVIWTLLRRNLLRDVLMALENARGHVSSGKSCYFAAQSCCNLPPTLCSLLWRNQPTNKQPWMRD